MGHVFVPAALVLWVGVALVRAFATPAPVQAPAPAVEVQVQQPRPAHSAGKSVSEADPTEARVHSEG